MGFEPIKTSSTDWDFTVKLYSPIIFIFLKCDLYKKYNKNKKFDPEDEFWILIIIFNIFYFF